MKVVLFGAGGMLGHDLRRTRPEGVELGLFTRADLDITDHGSVHRVIRAAQPNVIINAAAYTKVDDAESEADIAFAVNGTAAGAIGQAARDAGSVVVHFSTDYVFDGEAGRPYREDDPPNPLSVYGRSKLEGEMRLRDSGAAYLVIRTQWLFGAHGRSFPRTMWERAAHSQRTIVVADQTGRPTYTNDLAIAVWRLVHLGARDTLHIANEGTATWHDVARRVFSATGATALLAPCTTADYPTRARRPVAAVLDTSRFEQATGEALPRWEDALDRFLAEVRHARAIRASWG